MRERTARVMDVLPLRAVLVLTGSISVGGCFVEADLPELTITRQNLQFPGTGTVPPGVDPALAPEGATAPPGFDPALVPDEFADSKAVAQAEDLIESGALEGGVIEMTESFEQADELEFPGGLDTSLWPVSATLTVRSGATDLSFLHAFDVSVRCVSGALPTARLFTYVAEAGQVGPEVVAAADERVNVVDYWNCGQAFYDVHVVGTLPEQPWEVDVAFELSGNFRMTF